MGLGKFNANMLFKGNNNNNGNRNGNNGNNSGGKSRKERRREERERRSGRDYGNRSFSDFNPELLGEYDDEEYASDKPNRERELELAEKILDDFIEDFADILQEPGNKVANIIRDGFWDVCAVMTNCYDNAYKELVGKMNKVLEIVSRLVFARSLQIVLTNEDIDGWDGVDGIWKDVLFTLSTALITAHSKMKDEVVTIYLNLIASSGLAGKDIAMMVDKYGITKDLANDLIINIPVIPEDLTDITIGEFHASFIMRILDNAEDNIDVLDRGTQDGLFKFFFGDGQAALKTIGRMLADTAVGKFKNNSQNMVYKEYIVMLAKRLDAYDIKNIKYVLKYVCTQKKNRPNEEMVYDSVQIADYGSIRKAVLELIKENPEVKDLLA